MAIHDWRSRHLSMGVVRWVCILSCITRIAQSVIRPPIFRETLTYHEDPRNRSIATGQLRTVRGIVNDSPQADQASDTEIQVKLSYGVTAERKALITCEVIISMNPSEEREGGPRKVSRQSLKERSEKSSSLNQTTTWPPLNALYLVCPQVPTNICYMDCTPSCVLNEHGCAVPHKISHVIEDCRYSRPGQNNLMIQYTVNLEALDNTGQWNCDYRGQRAARPLELRAAERKSPYPSTMVFTSTPKPTSSVTMPLPNAIPVVQPTSTEGVSYSLQSNDIPYNQTGKDFIRNTKSEEKGRQRRINSSNSITSFDIKHGVSRGKVNPRLAQVLCFQPRRQHDQSPPPARGYPPNPLPLTSQNLPLTPETNSSYVQYPSSTDEHPNDALLFYANGQFSHSNGGSRLDSAHYRASNLMPGELTPLGPYGAINPIMFTNESLPRHLGLAGYAGVVPIANRTSPTGNGGSASGGGANNGSMTGSLVLTNESASFTDGNGAPSHPTTSGTPGGTSSLPIIMPVGTHSETYAQLERAQRYSDSRTSYLPSYISDQKEISKEGGGNSLIFANSRSPRNQMIDSGVLRQLSMIQSVPPTDMYEDNGTFRSIQLPPPMTPLVVRFPSGEAGYLIYPAAQGNKEELNNTNSLSRAFIGQGRVRNGQADEQSDRHTTQSTLVATDTESDSGCGAPGFPRSQKLKVSSEAMISQLQRSVSGMTNSVHLAPQDSNVLGQHRCVTTTDSLVHHSSSDIKSSSDDRTSLTNNSIITIDRSVSEADDMVYRSGSTSAERIGGHKITISPAYVILSSQEPPAEGIKVRLTPPGVAVEKITKPLKDSRVGTEELIKQGQTAIPTSVCPDINKKVLVRK
ncbi:unnamed protein product [Calicophoron daubneyi]|uniref:Uncharacterized protein n=1 Tax=Calicophoron daubneyi TaxID=300641 RepID=A0AAV2SX86_CALDB